MDVFRKFRIDQQQNLFKVSYPLVWLDDKLVLVAVITNLTVVIGDEKFKRDIYVEFTVADILLSYDAIFRWPILNNNGIIINIEYLCLKLPTVDGIAVARGSQKLAQEYYKQSTKVICQNSLPIDLLENTE